MRVQFLLLFLFVSLTRGFTYSYPRKARVPSLTKTESSLFHKQQQLSHPSSSLLVLNSLRGGDDSNMMNSVSTCIQSKSSALAALVSSSLLTGPWGVCALWGVASAVVVPLTLYRQAYSFSVGYGFSVLAMALALLFTFSPIVWSNPSYLLTLSAAFYGLRLGTFLSIRNVVNKAKGREMKNFDKTPRLKRIPFAASVALFYAFMVCPTLYALRAPPAVGSVASKIAYSGVAIAVGGALLEAIADWHKFYVKQKYGANTDIFVGPTGGVYRVCRHPNYVRHSEECVWSSLVMIV